jgi:large subunit ribosomal protein L10
VDQYGEWINDSRAMIVAEYTGLNMQNFDDLRSRVREAGGEFHVVKNTLVKLAFENAELSFDKEQFLESTAIGFAFEDAPALAKAITEFMKDVEFLKIKCGYLDKERISEAQIKALADLPSLPVMRATLLSTLLAPATKLTRILAEPGRSLAAVIRANADEAAPEAA